MGLSYAQAAGNQQCIADGGLVKRMQPGMTAEAGVRAAYLAQAGVTGAINAIEGKNGFFNVYEAGDYDAEKLTGGLGDSFEVERVGFKRYPVCGMAHPAIDVLRDMQRDNDFSLEDVDTLEAYGSKFVSDMVGRPYAPGDNATVDAQFSLQYHLASVLQSGNIRLTDLRPEHTLDPERRALANTLPVHLDDSLKGKWTARLELTLKDGRKLEGKREKAAGQSDRPLSTEELVEKFLDSNAYGGALDAGAAKQLADTLLDLPRLSALKPLCDALVPAEPIKRAV
jgi:2-methylcitrate dehydratase PrpD